MTDRARFRLAGLACLAAAFLRTLAAFVVGHVNETPLQGLYILTDLALTLGLTGWCLRWRDGLGRLGLGAWALALGGIMFIRSTAGDPAKYFFAAVLFSIAVAGIAIVGLASRRTPRLTPLLWLGSSLFGAVTGLAFPHASWPFLVASLILCAGFATAGADLLRKPGDA